jgi:gliding motility-associated lipoprotein GldH
MSKSWLILPFFALVFLLQSCGEQSFIDSNKSIDDNSWAYAKSVKETFEIKDAGKRYRLYLKLRHTTAYRYANLYLVMHLKGNGINKHTRYQFKLAYPDGRWVGKGSGDIYTIVSPLLTDYRFPKAGKYEIELEQNMRDNPLVGISDVGIVLEAQTSN